MGCLVFDLPRIYWFSLDEFLRPFLNLTYLYREFRSRYPLTAVLEVPSSQDPTRGDTWACLGERKLRASPEAAPPRETEAKAPRVVWGLDGPPPPRTAGAEGVVPPILVPFCHPLCCSVNRHSSGHFNTYTGNISRETFGFEFLHCELLSLLSSFGCWFKTSFSQIWNNRHSPSLVRYAGVFDWSDDGP